jgi:hypothetical protein
MPPFIVRPKEKSEDPNDYSGCNSTPWHPELTVLNLVVDHLKTEMISIKGHEYHSAQSSYQPHDLTYQSFCKTHVSHGNNALSSIDKTNSRGLDAFTSLQGQAVNVGVKTKQIFIRLIYIYYKFFFFTSARGNGYSYLKKRWKHVL